MTKYEFKVSMEEFNRLVDEHNFQEAVNVADTIDWNKVKDSQLLCRVSDIYKMLGEYEKSRNVLEMAYRQSSRNMNIVFSLCELDLFLFSQNGSQDCYLEAMQLYSTYLAMEPDSTKALILKYKVYQVSQSTWQEQEEVLQEILQRGYSAKYDYELARVYAQAGQSAAAMNECQKIMAANDGRYSKKAAELAGQLDPGSAYAQMRVQQAPSDNYYQQGAYNQAPQDQYVPQDNYSQQRAPQYDYGAQSGYNQADQYAPQDNYSQQRAPQYDYGAQGGYNQADQYAPQDNYNQQAAYNQAPQGQYASQGQYAPQDNYNQQGAPQYDYGTQNQQTAPSPYDYNNPQSRSNRYSASHSSAENAAQAARRAANAFTTQIQANAVRKATAENEQENISISAPDQTAAADSIQQNVRQGMKDIYARPYDNYMTQETNGQYAMVLDQGQSSEDNAQVDGQMSFQQYLDSGDWDSIRRSIRKNNDEIRANRVMQTTGELLKVFDEGTKHSLVEDIEKNVDRNARDYRLSGGAYDGQLDDGLTDGEKSRAIHVAGDAVREENSHAPSLVEDDDESITERRGSARIRREMRQKGPDYAQNDYSGDNQDNHAENQYSDNDQYYSDNDQYSENSGDQNAESGRYSEAEDAQYTEDDQQAESNGENTDHISLEVNDHIDSGADDGQEEDQYASVPEEDQIFTEVESEDDLESPELEAEDQTSGANDLETPDYNAEHRASADAESSAGDNKPTVDTASSDKTDLSDKADAASEVFKADTAEKKTDSGKTGENKINTESAVAPAADAVAEAARKAKDDSVQMAAADAIAKAAEAARAAKAAAQSGAQSAAAKAAAQSGTQDTTAKETDQSKTQITAVRSDAQDVKPSAEAQHVETIGELMDEAQKERETENNTGENDTADAVLDQQPSDVQNNPVNEQQPDVKNSASYGRQPHRQNSDSRQAASSYQQPQRPQQPQHQMGIRQLSEEEKKLFGSFAKVESNRVQIVKALDTISLASYTGNVIVTGTNEDAPDRIVKGLLTMIRDSDHNFTGRAARVTAEALNKRFAERRMGFMSQLENGAMVIEHAGGLNGDTVRYLYSQLEQREHGLIVFLVDTKRAMDHLLAQFGNMLGSFNARIDIQYLDDRSLVKYGIAYADSQDYSIDEMGVMALSSRISARQSATHQVTMQEVRDIVDEAIRSASKKTPRHLADLMSRRRFDKDDRIVLRERDFGVVDRK